MKSAFPTECRDGRSARARSVSIGLVFMVLLSRPVTGLSNRIFMGPAAGDDSKKGLTRRPTAVGCSAYRAEKRIGRLRMNCPKCEKPLEKKTLQSVKVDACPSCSGSWFDAKELAYLVKTWKDLPDLKKGKPDKWREAPFNCPKCGVRLIEFYYDREADTILVEMCEKCRGIWLDDSELQRINLLQRDRNMQETSPEHYYLKRRYMNIPMGVWIVLLLFILFAVMALFYYVLKS